MEEMKRIRVIFKDDDILSAAQKSDGLSRCWALLKPHQHHTVSDVASHILHAFHLHQSCPHGLILSISGFVLPPFESTNILKDYEIVRVQKRKEVLLIAENDANNGAEKLKAVEKRKEVLLIAENDANNGAEKLKAVEKQPVNNGLLLLGNEEFEKEKGGYERDNPEGCDEDDLLDDVEDPSGLNANKVNRKRKAAVKHRDSKAKKHRSDATGNASNDIPTDKSQKIHQVAELTMMKDDSCMGKKDDPIAGDSVENNGEQRTNKVQEDSKETMDAEIAHKEKKKVPSRSARRKYAKRRWLQEMAKIQKQNANCESEGLRNWKEDQAKAGRKKVDRLVEKGLKKLKKYQADAEEKVTDGQPKGLLHWTPQDNWFVKGKKREQRSQNNNCSELSRGNDDAHEQQIQIGEGHEQITQNGDGHRKLNQKHGNSHKQPGQKYAAVQEYKNQSCDAAEQLNQESAEESEVVPIIIRPGHIRFEPLGKEQVVLEDHMPQETFNWNGITSKKKGQQWGKEGRDRPFISCNDHKTSNEEASEILSNEKEKQVDVGADLDKLPPLLGMPKKGDLIAYRVLELSSSWTPELSAYRVGKVSWYNTISNQTMLVQVPEYPILSKKADDDDEAAQSDNSLYKEDGSLEIDFSSLIDVRIFNNGGTEQGNDGLNCASEFVGDVNAPNTVLPISFDKPTVLPSHDSMESNQGKETEAPTAENVVASIWDQLSETINAKKEQLSKENGWGCTPKKVQASHQNFGSSTPKKVQASHQNFGSSTTKKVQASGENSRGKMPSSQTEHPSGENNWGKQSSSRKSWSHKTLRGSALGPTMAMLRSNRDS